MDRAINTCVYMDCSNSQIRARHISYFGFPLRDKDRLEKWKNNCGNKNILSMDNQSLKRRVICEEHFRLDDYYHSGNRSLLRKTAVPVPFGCDKEDEMHVCKERRYQFRQLDQSPKYVYGRVAKKACSLLNRQSVSSNAADPKSEDNFCDAPSEEDRERYPRNIFGGERTTGYLSPISQSAPYSSGLNDHKHTSVSNITLTENYLQLKCRRLANRIQELEKKLAAKQHRCKSLELKLKRSGVQGTLEGLVRDRSPEWKAFMISQFSNKIGMAWTTSAKELALTLYEKSPELYKFMLINLKFVLPSIRMIQVWSKTSDIKTESELEENGIDIPNVVLKDELEYEYQDIIEHPPQNDSMVLKKEEYDYNATED